MPASLHYRDQICLSNYYLRNLKNESAWKSNGIHPLLFFYWPLLGLNVPEVLRNHCSHRCGFGDIIHYVDALLWRDCVLGKAQTPSPPAMTQLRLRLHHCDCKRISNTCTVTSSQHREGKTCKSLCIHSLHLLFLPKHLAALSHLNTKRIILADEPSRLAVKHLFSAFLAKFLLCFLPSQFEPQGALQAPISIQIYWCELKVAIYCTAIIRISWIHINKIFLMNSSTEFMFITFALINRTFPWAFH